MTTTICAVMGIVNVTPDSFSDGGDYLDPADAVAHGLTLVDHGARVLDIGGASSRPGADEVGEDVELARVVPVIELLSSTVGDRVRLSVDTRSPRVAAAAVAAGATMINDVSATLSDLAGDLGVAYVAMHSQGNPQTMQLAPHYDDVVGEVEAFLSDLATTAKKSGVLEVWIDPGLGFGKLAEHNWALIAHLDRLVALGYPVLVGASRKAWLGATLAASDGVDGVGPLDRREASLAVATYAMHSGVHMVRAHDVRMTVHAARVVSA